ncbi:LOW QUALITY PROTEIN: hypothetical protein V1477_003320 [Vespula maculifrons]|uniref:Uncharacterized protein n=1 Tax=Vespula maculifrons TaxID=7453 RepID=A0ABD2CU69_VESMC
MIGLNTYESESISITKFHFINFLLLFKTNEISISILILIYSTKFPTYLEVTFKSLEILTKSFESISIGFEFYLKIWVCISRNTNQIFETVQLNWNIIIIKTNKIRSLVTAINCSCFVCTSAQSNIYHQTD